MCTCIIKSDWPLSSCFFCFQGVTANPMVNDFSPHYKIFSTYHCSLSVSLTVLYFSLSVWQGYAQN